MKTSKFFALIAILATGATNAQAATVTFTENITERYVDVKYTPTAGTEFTNWDLIATPAVGSILDPTTSQKAFNASSGAIPVDTFANTVFSAVGAGGANYVHTMYNPGTAFPPVPADAPPTAGAQAPAPNALNWSIFDTATGDGAIAGFTPYLMARVVYSQGGNGTITAKFFDTGNAGIGETFSTPYGVPEPTTALMAGLSLLGVVASRRRKA